MTNPVKPLECAIQGSAIVIRANVFNPSIFTTHWLINKVGCSEDDLSQTEIPAASFTSPEVTQIFGKYFRLTVQPSGLQLTPLIGNKDVDEQVKLAQLARKIVELLPEVPYSAVGCNTDWVHQSDDIKTLSRRLFFNSQSSLFNEFNTDDARFGAYMSRDFKDARLKLTVKPSIVELNPLLGGEMKRNHVIHFNFNFHKDVTSGPDSLKSIHEALDNAPAYIEESKRLLSVIW